MTAQHTLGEWMDTALVDAPPDLAIRIESALHEGWRDEPASSGSAVMMDAAVTELKVLLARGCETRWAAPGLLAVDALVTHACELVARAGDDVDAGCEQMIRQIVGVAAGASVRDDSGKIA